MTDAAAPDPGAEADLAAAELALGVLAGEERAAALRRLAAEPAFARAVARWGQHFGGLLADVPAVAPPPALAARVVARIAADVAPVVPLRALARWRAAAMAAGALAAGLAGVLALRPAPGPAIVPSAAPAAGAVMVAALQMPGGTQAMLATYDDRHGLRLAGALPVPARHSAELWVIAGTAPPRAVGVLRAVATDEMTLTAPPRQPMPAGAVLAISIEPGGGAPGDLPTGPVVASGRLRAV